jgi:nucleoside-diphosphate-sugar epimerase
VRVFITGVTGFVGSTLGRHFQSRGCEVLGTSTRPGARDLAVASIVAHRLGERVDPRWLVGVDVLVHAAWDLAPTASSSNLAGSELWREAAASSGAHALFISSYSAYTDCPTRYGRDKALAEAAFAGPAATVVRPALIVGGGGLFASLVAAVLRGRILPLPDGGRPGVDLVDVSDLCDAVCTLASERRAGSHDLSAGRLSLREVCGGIARALGRPPRPVMPIPTAPARLALDLFARGGIALGVRERWLGYMENAKRSRRSSLAGLLGRSPVPPLKSVLARAARLALDAS